MVEEGMTIYGNGPDKPDRTTVKEIRRPMLEDGFVDFTLILLNGHDEALSAEVAGDILLALLEVEHFLDCALSLDEPDCQRGTLAMGFTFQHSSGEQFVLTLSFSHYYPKRQSLNQDDLIPLVSRHLGTHVMATHAEWIAPYQP